MNPQQYEKVKSAKGFIAALDQSGGSTPKALSLYGIEGTLFGRSADVRPDPRDAHADHHQPGVQRRSHPGRDPVRTDDGPRDRGTRQRRLPLVGEAGGSFPEGRQGPGRRGERRADDEGDAQPRRLACACQGQGRLRDQDALGREARRRQGHRGCRRPAVHDRQTDPRGGPHAHHRARGRHPRHGQGKAPSGSSRRPSSSTSIRWDRSSR